MSDSLLRCRMKKLPHSHYPWLRKGSYLAILFVLVVTLRFENQAESAETARQPNILVILADDKYEQRSRESGILPTAGFISSIFSETRIPLNCVRFCTIQAD